MNIIVNDYVAYARYLAEFQRLRAEQAQCGPVYRSLINNELRQLSADQAAYQARCLEKEKR